MVINSIDINPFWVLRQPSSPGPSNNWRSRVAYILLTNSHDGGFLVSD